MKLLLKFGLAALLVAFLAVPSLARKAGGEGTSTGKTYESSKEPEVQPSSQERVGTKTKKPIPPPGAKGDLPEIKGESQDDKHKDEIH
jgi:hypothetical protein